MNKSLFLLVAITVVAIGSAKAQFANTSWKGKYCTAVDFIIHHFNNIPTLTVLKISGGSSCNDEKGIYKFLQKKINFL